MYQENYICKSTGIKKIQNHSLSIVLSWQYNGNMLSIHLGPEFELLEIHTPHLQAGLAC